MLRQISSGKKIPVSKDARLKSLPHRKTGGRPAGYARTLHSQKTQMSNVRRARLSFDSRRFPLEEKNKYNQKLKEVSQKNVLLTQKKSEKTYKKKKRKILGTSQKNSKRRKKN